MVQIFQKAGDLELTKWIGGLLSRKMPNFVVNLHERRMDVCVNIIIVAFEVRRCSSGRLPLYLALRNGFTPAWPAVWLRAMFGCEVGPHCFGLSEMPASTVNQGSRVTVTVLFSEPNQGRSMGFAVFAVS